MKTLLDLITSANDFALETMDETPSPTLTTRALQAFQDAKGATADWSLWNETANNARAQFKLRREDKLPSQIVTPPASPAA
jgi:hypothetical protein